jgi:hypothetical protein
VAQVGFQPAVNYSIGPNPDGVCLADFNADGHPDMAVTSDAPDKIVVRFNLGNGTFGAPVTTLLGGGTSPHTPVAADLDGDTDIDIAVSLKNTNQVQVLVNDGSGGFSLGSTTGVGAEPRSMAAADLDGDTDVDLVSSNRDGGSLSVLVNNGSADFTATILSTGARPREVGVADFTGDGRPDLAVAVHDTASVTVFANSATGFSQLVNLQLGGNRKPQGLDVGDFDRNGTMDIAVSSENNGIEYASTFLNNGGGSFAAPVHLILSGADASSLTAGDFDLDGDLDLAIANTDSNNVSIIENLGGGAFGNEALRAVGTAPGHIVDADLNGDASPDLACANQDSSNGSVLLSQASCGTIVTFCTAKSGLACGVPAISAGGTPSASATGGFTISASPARSNRPGVLLYNTERQVPAASFGGGTLCVRAAGIRRAGPTNSGGSADCDGVFSIDMNTFAQGLWPQPSTSPAPFLLEIGATVRVQFWGRDSIATGTFLSDALEYVVCP